MIMSLPWPSARTCTAVLKPPWLRPGFGLRSPLCPQPHASGLYDGVAHMMDFSVDAALGASDLLHGGENAIPTPALRQR